MRAFFHCGERVEKLDSEGGKRSRKQRLRSEPIAGKTRKTASACSKEAGAPNADTSTTGRPDSWECPRCRNTTSSRFPNCAYCGAGWLETLTEKKRSWACFECAAPTTVTRTGDLYFVINTHRRPDGSSCPGTGRLAVRTDRHTRQPTALRARPKGRPRPPR